MSYIHIALSSLHVCCSSDTKRFYELTGSADIVLTSSPDEVLQLIVASKVVSANVQIKNFHPHFWLYK